MPEYGVQVTIGFEHESDYLIFLEYCDNENLSFRASVKKLVYDKIQEANLIKKDKIKLNKNTNN